MGEARGGLREHGGDNVIKGVAGAGATTQAPSTVGFIVSPAGCIQGGHVLHVLRCFCLWQNALEKKSRSRGTS